MFAPVQFHQPVQLEGKQFHEAEIRSRCFDLACFPACFSDQFSIASQTERTHVKSLTQLAETSHGDAAGIQSGDQAKIKSVIEFQLPLNRERPKENLARRQ